ncbi:hypothetical protein AB6E53_06680 [Vibrio breoganii]
MELSLKREKMKNMTMDELSHVEAADRMLAQITSRYSVMVFVMGEYAYIGKSSNAYSYIGSIKLDGFGNVSSWIKTHLPVTDVALINCDTEADCEELQLKAIAKLIEDGIDLGNIRWTKGSSRAIQAGSEHSFIIDKYLPEQKKINRTLCSLEEVTIPKTEYDKLLKLQDFVNENKLGVMSVKLESFNPTLLRKYKRTELTEKEKQLVQWLLKQGYRLDSIADSFSVECDAIAQLIDWS